MQWTTPSASQHEGNKNITSDIPSDIPSDITSDIP
jgi:hypothetical protein